MIIQQKQKNKITVMKKMMPMQAVSLMSSGFGLPEWGQTPDDFPVGLERVLASLHRYEYLFGSQTRQPGWVFGI